MNILPRVVRRSIAGSLLLGASLLGSCVPGEYYYGVDVYPYADSYAYGPYYPYSPYAPYYRADPRYDYGPYPRPYYYGYPPFFG